ncbi:hypothetical protein EPYR_03295 [Erwinia pyrifoliae DSM 12163]|nr:hypothetical protein EPYR_03295 [Erwinia pyrifoliae DSM 12163]
MLDYRALYRGECGNGDRCRHDKIQRLNVLVEERIALAYRPNRLMRHPVSFDPDGQNRAACDAGQP